MTLSIAPITQAVVAQPVTLDAALQPGTVVAAQVLTLLDANLVRLAIANLTLDVATAVPLQAGQALQLAVTQTKDGLRLVPVVPDLANATRGNAVITDDIPLVPKSATPTEARPVLSLSETRAVAAAAEVAVTQQAGLSPLFANLTAAVTSDRLPQPVLLAAAQVLALRQPSDKALTGSDIKAAMTSSGLMLEASLATTSLGAAMPDMKAALTVLRQALATWLEPLETSPDWKPMNEQPSDSQRAFVTSKAPPQPTATASTKAPTIAVVSDIEAAELLVTAANASINRPSQHVSGADVDDSSVPARHGLTPPPFRGALPSAQAVATPTLAPDAVPTVVARQLIADTDGALARQTLLQIASLPDRVDITMPRNEALQPRWNFEIPFITPHGTAMAQFEIARDGSGNDADASQRVWRARFSLDIEPAGPVHALISFSGEKTSVKMWAERPATAAQLRANAVQLGASLDRADLKAGDILIAEGAPTRTQAPRAGHFLNRAL